jgi:peptidoglycan lytic transglycosylase D
VAALSIYMSSNVLLVLAATLLAALRAISPTLRQPIAYRHQLRLGQALILAAVLLPAVCSLWSRHSFLPQTAQVWSAPALANATVPDAEGAGAVSFGSSSAAVPLDVVSQIMAVLVMAGLALVLVQAARDAAATLRIIGDAHVIRRHGSARILASERIEVPFAFWLPARYFIVVPSALVLRCHDFRVSIRHEAQHHRQQDTKLVYLQQLLRAVFFWNPASHCLERQLRELEEFSCDEALAVQRSISARDYCQCLLRVAEAATLRRRPPLQAGMVSGGAGHMLESRIKAILTRPSAYLKRVMVFATGAAALTLMGATALALPSTIRDRRVSAEVAGRMAAIAQQGSSFPIVANERVLRELNLLLSTPDGRAYLQASLERMRGYQTLLSERLLRAGMPLDLLAVPLVESGYRNLPQSDDPSHGAGLWMFIAPTARHFGLTVDVTRDERLDVAAETGAAVRMLSSLYHQFDDWGLALLAYNAGNARVERAIAQTGSRDVWELIARGHENDSGYVARVMATLLILRNPGVLN